ncbi:MAG: glycogen/starch/alpha-glucan phosphorylase [Desulfobacteraceae bacterium]|jgi:starch phosphorylase
MAFFKKKIIIENDRIGTSTDTLKRAILDNLFYIQGKFANIANRNDYYMALAYTVRDRLLHRWIKTIETIIKEDVKIVCYLSAEFLLGPHLGNNLINLDIYEPARQAVAELGQDLEDLIEQEEEPGLGNGGLGRLAACYLESMATLQIPSISYGIRYEHGIFHQELKDGWQVEKTDNWLQLGNPWELARPEMEFNVKLGGYTETYTDLQGHQRIRWIPHRMVKGIPYDTPIVGYKVNNCNTLRLWKSVACEEFNLNAFNCGDYYGAVDQKITSENLTKVLYPNDEPAAGKRLRLEQQYFFVSCSLQNIIAMHLFFGGKLDQLNHYWAVHLNDTHPAIAVAELMRLLVDEHDFKWEKAWKITCKTMAYTNHTLLPEALEKWPLNLFGEVLPRHLEIIYKINFAFLEKVRQRFPEDEERIARMSLIDESGEKYIRMANLACVGSHAINGVANLHTELLKRDVLKDFYELMPEKFSNKTNGVTPRRFMVLSNPKLSYLITRTIGSKWITDLTELHCLEPYSRNKRFIKKWHQIKFTNKKKLAHLIYKQTGVQVLANSLFDILVKRIHEYKRQHLLVLYIITLYNRIKANPGIEIVPRTFIFSGKAAPGYFLAKLIIKLINSVAVVINQDKDIRNRLKVIFIPDFNVKVAQHIYPAADLSEQISTAGKEASGTGNMKFAMNGALTIGTLDGANIEIRNEVGSENFFLFGHTAEQVQLIKSKGYRPRDYYETDIELNQAIKQIKDGFFSNGDKHLFQPLVENLLDFDNYLVLADYRSYVECQQQVTTTYQDSFKWAQMSILNAAHMGKFSSDRAIKQYCENIWKTSAITIASD